MPTIDRRLFLALSAGAAMTTGISVAAEDTKTAPRTVPEGRPGDFAFLTGEWRIHNRFRENGTWIEFPGEATVVAILGGIASIEELRIPARNFSGMGLRLLDIERKIWSDHWVNAKSGVVAVPGQLGGFEGGVGTFTSSEEIDGVSWTYRGVWDRITPTSCRWHQGSSNDGGATWDDSWFMDWTRVS